ncbi:BatD family protein [Bordetella petrii]|uniref:BatD family protein n=1 Tax=Bordetella petrii TaxID=94624 RepID=UPI001A960968|nr:BatD family protein [Bordetella petrii]MBO1113855.1 BatD family protein [Bordetella petrii]
MMSWRRFFAWAQACLAVACAQALAQEAPALRVTAHLQTPAQAQVGATLKLELEVATPTWFTQPPRLPALELPGVMVTAPAGQGAIVREQHDGVTYNGLRYIYLLSPTVAGTLRVPALTVSAQIGPGRTAVTASSTPFSFDVAAGTSAAGGRGVATGKFTISQGFDSSPDPLVKGGRVTRSITQRAEGEQAMLLPAAPLDDVPGFKRYPREPEVTTLTDGRGGFVGGQRIDRADYVAQQTGQLSLPGLVLHWRDSTTGLPRRQELPGRTFSVSAGPPADPPFSLAQDLAQLRHDLRWVLPGAWLAWGAGLAVVVLAVWLGWPWWRCGMQAMRLRLRQARMRRRGSEPWHWRAWRREARREAEPWTAFYRWLRVAAGVDDLRAAVRRLGKSDAAAADQALRGAYGKPAAGAWRAILLRASPQWRRTWLAQHTPARPHALSETLNPTGAAGPASSFKEGTR